MAAGGVVFTTIQKFLPDARGDVYPELSARENVVVIADEAHRSQYGFIDGFARHMSDALPNASFIGFTGTPIEATDKNTRAVFGDYISVYDILRAVQDGATVPIYYESRLAKLELKASEKPRLDEQFDEVTEGEELAGKEKLKNVQSRSFSELLEKAVRRYQNRAVEAAQVIEELIGLARDLRAAQRRGEELRLNDDELASTTRSRSTTAPSRSSATRPSSRSPASSS